MAALLHAREYWHRSGNGFQGLHCVSAAFATESGSLLPHRRIFLPLDEMNPTLSQKLFAEVLGTFCLVFVGTAAIVVNDLGEGVITHAGVALAFGLIVLAMIYAIGDISGAHINPAVTIAFAFARRLPLGLVGPYIAAQCAGAILASLTVLLLFPTHETLGQTVPSGSLMQSFVLEIVLTFMLMFVILSVSTGAKEKGITAGIAVGAVVGLEALFGGPVSGASMNPARSLGPALACFDFTYLWFYIAAPIIGALVAVPACRCIREDNCCAEGSACSTE